MRYSPCEGAGNKDRILVRGSMGEWEIEYCEPSALPSAWGNGLFTNCSGGCADFLPGIAPATLNNVSAGLEECRVSPTHYLLNLTYSRIRAACECFANFTGVSCELHLL